MSCSRNNCDKTCLQDGMQVICTRHIVQNVGLISTSPGTRAEILKSEGYDVEMMRNQEKTSAPLRHPRKMEPDVQRFLTGN
jgi:hypothetical protein